MGGAQLKDKGSCCLQTADAPFQGATQPRPPVRPAVCACERARATRTRQIQRGCHLFVIIPSVPPTSPGIQDTLLLACFSSSSSRPSPCVRATTAGLGRDSRKTKQTSKLDAACRDLVGFLQSGILTAPPFEVHGAWHMALDTNLLATSTSLPRGRTTPSVLLWRRACALMNWSR